MSLWNSGLSAGVSLGRPWFKPLQCQISLVINGFVETHAILYFMHHNKNGQGDY
jgi:hypothetical protein